MGAWEPADFENGSVDRFAGGSGGEGDVFPRAGPRPAGVDRGIHCAAGPPREHAAAGTGTGPRQEQVSACRVSSPAGFWPEGRGEARVVWTAQAGSAHRSAESVLPSQTPRPLPLRCAFLTCFARLSVRACACRSPHPLTSLWATLMMGRRCTYADCEHRRVYGPPPRMDGNRSRPLFCYRHKNEGDVDLVHKRCMHIEGCRKNPHFGSPGDRIPRFCQTHKEDGHVDVKNRKCSWTGWGDGAACRRNPSYGYVVRGLLVPSMCSRHRTSGMVSLFANTKENRTRIRRRVRVLRRRAQKQESGPFHVILGGGQHVDAADRKQGTEEATNSEREKRESEFWRRVPLHT